MKLLGPLLVSTQTSLPSFYTVDISFDWNEFEGFNITRSVPNIHSMFSSDLATMVEELGTNCA